MYVYIYIYTCSICTRFFGSLSLSVYTCSHPLFLQPGRANRRDPTPLLHTLPSRQVARAAGDHPAELTLQRRKIARYSGLHGAERSFEVNHQGHNTTR